MGKSGPRNNSRKAHWTEDEWLEYLQPLADAAAEKKGDDAPDCDCGLPIHTLANQDKNGWNRKCGKCLYEAQAQRTKDKREREDREALEAGFTPAHNKRDANWPYAYTGLRPLTRKRDPDPRDGFGGLGADDFDPEGDDGDAPRPSKRRRRTHSYGLRPAPPIKAIALVRAQKGRPYQTTLTSSDPDRGSKHPLVHQPMPEYLVSPTFGASIPLPAFFPNSSQPFLKDNIYVVRNFRKMASAWSRLQASEAWREPQPAKCDTCNVPLDWRKGDPLLPPFEHAGKVYVSYRLFSGHRFCREHLMQRNSARYKESTTRKLLAELDEDAEEEQSGTYATVRYRLYQLAGSTRDANRNHEIQCGISEADGFNALFNSPSDSRMAFAALVFRIFRRDAPFPGDKVRFSSIDWTNNALIDLLLKDLEEATCFHCGRSVTLLPPTPNSYQHLGIDRLNSRLPYTHPLQQLVISCFGCNIALSDMDHHHRQIYQSYVEHLPATIVAGDAALRCQEYVMGLADKSYTAAQYEEDRSILDGSFGMTDEALDAEWHSHGKDDLYNQSCRAVLASRRDVGRLYTNGAGDLVIDRRGWAEGEDATDDDHARVFEKYLASTRGVCVITGRSGLRAKGAGAKQCLALSVDRIFNRDVYRPENCLLMLGAVNYFKVTLPYLDTVEEYDEFLERQPNLRAVKQELGIKQSVVAYIRAALLDEQKDGVWGVVEADDEVWEEMVATMG